MSSQEVKRHSVRGVVATLARRLTTQGVQFVSIVMLARLLTPAETGVVAMATAFTGFAALLAELQFTTLTIMSQRLDQLQCSTLFWVRLLLTSCAALVVMAAAPAAGHFYGDPRVSDVLRVLALCLPLSALGAQHAALLARNLRADATARVAIAAVIVTSVVAVAGAVAHLGYWALVAGSLSGNATSAAMLWASCDWRPSLPKPDRNLRSALMQGAQFSTFNVLAYVAGYLPHVLVGRAWGAAATGLYARGTSLNALMLGTLWEPLDAVAGPALARLRSEPERMARYYYRTSTLLIAACLPVAFLGLALSAEVVNFLLGPQWGQSAHVLRWLAVGTLPSVICHTAGWVFFSVGDSRAVMRWGLIGWPAMMAATLIGNPFGPAAIAAALSLTSLILTIPCLTTAFRGTPLRIALLLRAIAPALAAALGAAVLALLVLLELPTELALLRLVAGMGTFGVVYLGLLLTVCGQRPFFAELLTEFRQRGAAHG
jgi:PST family polysaccharide transporter